MTTPTLPVIDLTPLAAGGDATAPATATIEALDRACRETGFFAVEGHGITAPVRDRMFAATRALFDLDEATKATLDISNSNCHRGYVGIARETLGDGEPPDLKEAFELSRDLGPDHPEVVAGTPLHGPNQWPDLEGFRTAVDQYFDAAFATALTISRGLALALGLDPQFFESRMGESVTNLRLLHYPPQASVRPTTDQPGCGEHTDYGMITLLATDGVAGLQVRSRAGQWIDVEVSGDQLVVNLGDMLARWTNDRWVSTPHRVITPAFEDRYSIPLFVNPDFHTMVEPVPTADGEASGRYAPISAGEYLLSRFDATHSYRAPRTIL